MDVAVVSDFILLGLELNGACSPGVLLLGQLQRLLLRDAALRIFRMRAGVALIFFLRISTRPMEAVFIPLEFGRNQERGVAIARLLAAVESYLEALGIVRVVRRLLI